MKKKKSVFSSIFLNNVLLSAILIFVIFTLVAYFFSMEFKNKEIDQQSRNFNEYVDTVKTTIETSVQMSTYVLQNHEFMLNLTKSFENHYTEMYDFLTESEMYIRTFFATDDIGEFYIYNPNETLYENAYIVHADKLPDYQQLKKELIKSSDGIIWDTKVQILDGKMLLKIYRNIPVKNGGIMMFTIKMPPTPEDVKYVIASSNNPVETSDETLVLYETINDDFIIYHELDEKTLHKHDVTIYTSFFAVFIFVTLVYILMANLIQKRTSKNITGFISSLESTEYVVSDKELETTDEDSVELKVIKEAVNSLKREIKLHINNRYNEKYERKKLKLELLQSKIDPHLLYNSLSYLNLGAAKNGDSGSVEIISVLSDYYRRVLSKGKDMSTLREEIEMLRLYIRVVELSQKCKLYFHVSVPDELQDMRILHLLLQPFVENSVKHGLSGRDEGSVYITVSKNGGLVTIVVEDDGFGIEPRKLEVLNHMDPEKKDKARGYGTYNIYERLVIYYGEEESSLTFFSEENRGTRVIIQFNIESEGERL